MKAGQAEANLSGSVLGKGALCGSCLFARGFWRSCENYNPFTAGFTRIQGGRVSASRV
ncbi:MAG: hypothetical protein ACTTH5_02410 [Wolinella sp.]